MARNSEIVREPLAAATAACVLPATPDRVAVLLCAVLTGSITWSNSGGVTAGDGIVLAAGATPVALTRREHGDLVELAWYAFHTAGGVSAVAVQTVEL